MTPPKHLLSTDNKLCSSSLNNNLEGTVKINAKHASRDGFNRIKDGAGVLIASINNRAANNANQGVGADWVEPSIIKAIGQTKYTYVSVNEVGPQWMRQ